jgi:hypothetical protein
MRHFPSSASGYSVVIKKSNLDRMGPEEEVSAQKPSRISLYIIHEVIHSSQGGSIMGVFQRAYQLELHACMAFLAA